MKKGKAVKNAIESFCKARDSSAREQFLLKGLSDPEMVAIMIGDVKVSVPSLLVNKGKKPKQRGEV